MCYLPYTSVKSSKYSSGIPNCEFLKLRQGVVNPNGMAKEIVNVSTAPGA